MIVRNKISITFPLPMSYGPKIKNVRGVDDISWANWFGGFYQDQKQFFAQFAVDADSYLRIYPELLVSDDERKAFLGDKTGALVGDLLAEKWGWKVGDKVTLSGTIFPGAWDFTIRGIYKGRDKATDRQTFFFHWKYLDDSVPEDSKLKNSTGLYIIKVASGIDSTQIAQTIDKSFANSLAETRTESEKQFQLSFISMAGSLIDAIQLISLVVLLILMLIIGNTLAMATRERTTEYGAMRAIGFRPGHIVGLVIGEGFVVSLTGAALGVALSVPILKTFADFFQKMMGNFLGSFDVSIQAIGLATAAALVGGMIASVIPAWRAGQLKIVDALRRIE
jgi:putative ABC transport system permease protein